MTDAIRAGHEADHLHRFQCGGPGIDRIGPDIGQHIGLQRQDVALGIQPQLGLDHLIEALGGDRQILQPVGGPFHRPRKLPRQYTHQQLFHVERSLAAKATADIGCHHPQAVARQLEQIDQCVANDARHLSRGMQGQAALAGIELGQIAARFHCQRALAMHAKASLHPHCGAGHDSVRIATGEAALQQQVGARRLVQQRRTLGQCILGAVDGRQHIELDLHQLGGVLGDVTALGQYRHHRFADIAHLFLRQRPDRCGVVVLHARAGQYRPAQPLQIGSTEHRNHPRHGPCCRQIDRHNAGMRLLAAPERHMQQPLAIVQRLQIIDIAAMAGEQTRILQPRLARADQTTGGDAGMCGGGRQCSAMG